MKAVAISEMVRPSVACFSDSQDIVSQPAQLLHDGVGEILVGIEARHCRYAAYHARRLFNRRPKMGQREKERLKQMQLVGQW